MGSIRSRSALRLGAALVAVATMLVLAYPRLKPEGGYRLAFAEFLQVYPDYVSPAEIAKGVRFVTDFYGLEYRGTQQASSMPTWCTTAHMKNTSSTCYGT